MKTSTFRKLLLGLVLLSLGGHARGAGAPWVTFENCRLLPNPANDGDSFHVRANGREYIFRLYFVDTPETEATYPARVAQQATYFSVTVPQALQIGKEAERFTRERLSRPFTIITRKQDARGESRLRRYFAFVEMDHADLAEELVANGLARIYGAKTQAPAMKVVAAEEGKLRQLEANARAQKVGGWGIGVDRLTVRAEVSPGSAEAAGARSDSFAAFFHPSPAPTAVAIETDSFSGDRLDINTASSEALQGLPGIGPVLAARIIAARPFKSADELERVGGIGPKKYAQLRPRFL